MGTWGREREGERETRGRTDEEEDARELGEEHWLVPPQGSLLKGDISGHLDHIDNQQQDEDGPVDLQNRKTR